MLAVIWVPTMEVMYQRFDIIFRVRGPGTSSKDAAFFKITSSTASGVIFINFCESPLLTCEVSLVFGVNEDISEIRAVYVKFQN